MHYKVIGDEKWHGRGSKGGAKGICGSGIIDMVAEVFKAGIIDKTGRMNKKLETDRLRFDENGKPEYILVFAEDSAIGKDITVTQGDIREMLPVTEHRLLCWIKASVLRPVTLLPVLSLLKQWMRD